MSSRRNRAIRINPRWRNRRITSAPAPASLAADAGVAIGAGTDVAVQAGDVVLVRSDPRDMARIIESSTATYRKMMQSLWWATGYDVIAIPLATGWQARVCCCIRQLARSSCQRAR